MYNLNAHSPEDTDTNDHTSEVSGVPATNHDNHQSKKKMPTKKNEFWAFA